MAGNLRRLVKPAVEAILAGDTARRIGHRRRRGQHLILAYHNVAPSGSLPRGDRSLHLDFDRFRRHVDVLQTSGAVVPLSEALEGTGERPCFALTFDDAYTGAVRLALPELSNRQLPVTLFVAPGLLGLAAPWWDALASEASGVSETTRAMLLEDFAGEGERIIRWATQHGHQQASDQTFGIANNAELIELANLPGMTLGAHSWSHPNLTRLPDGQLQQELGPPLQWLRERLPGRVHPWLAYPYGLFDQRVATAAVAAGYSAGFAIRGGWHDRSASPMAIPRLNVPASLSPSGLKARLNGLLNL